MCSILGKKLKSLRLKEMLNLWVFWCCLFYLMCDFAASGLVILVGNNATLYFEDIEAKFASIVTGSGKCGTLNVAEPLDACSPLTNKIVPHMNDTRYPFVLIIRGGCSFEDKVLRAQAAGFKAAIVYDNEVRDFLIAMGGIPFGIKISAVFVSKVAGETLAKYAGSTDMELWIVPSFEKTSWFIVAAISFFTLLGMTAVATSCFYVRRGRRQESRERPLAPRLREFHRISRLVKAMPTLIFTAVLEDNCTSETCAICLEDYNVGEKLRILPCYHKFHAACIDTWLTSWRTFCPVCKRDARTTTGKPPVSESTPLLSSAALPITSSSMSLSSSLQVGSSSYPSQSVSPHESLSIMLYNLHSIQAQHQSHHLIISQSSVDQPIPPNDIESSAGC